MTEARKSEWTARIDSVMNRVSGAPPQGLRSLGPSGGGCEPEATHSTPSAVLVMPGACLSKKVSSR
jgi:hypothetical protein